MALRDLCEWSPRDNSLREVVEVFQNQLPILVIVNEGYSGRDGMHEFASDEIYWIFDIQKQDRVVAKAALERYVSIPVDYPVPFQRIINGTPDGLVVTMSSIIEDDDCRGQKIRFKDDARVQFNFGADDGNEDQFGEMEVIETYSEKYFLCHSIVKNEIHPSVIGIPAYVPIRMKVATGFVYDRSERFAKWMKDVTEIGRSLENTRISLRQEILIFHESPGGDYEYISPLKFTAKSYDADSDSEGHDSVGSISSWQFPQVTFTPKKCQTVARNPNKVCIRPIPVPPIPSEADGSSLTFEKASRSGSTGHPRLPTRLTKMIERRGVFPQPVAAKSSTTLPSKMRSMSQDSGTTLPPKVRSITQESNTTLPHKMRSMSQDSGTTLPLKVRSMSQDAGGTMLMSSSRTLPKEMKPGRLVENEEAEEEGKGFPQRTAWVSPTMKTTRNTPLPPPSAFALAGPVFPTMQRRVFPGSVNRQGSLDSSNGVDIHPVLPLSDRRLPLQKPGNSHPLLSAGYYSKNNVMSSNYDMAPVTPPRSNASLPRLTPSDRYPEPPGGVTLMRSNWESLEDVPVDVDVSRFSVEQVCRCLELLDINDFVPAFRKKKIDGRFLLTMDVPILMGDFGMKKVDALRLTMFAVDKWRPLVNSDNE